MSRLSKNPIQIQEKVNLNLSGTLLTVTGPKGELKRDFKIDIIDIKVSDTEVMVEKKVNTVFSRALVGTYASHIKNMMEGVTNGFVKKLIIEGVGFRAAVKGKQLEMQLGFSHPVIMDIFDGLDVVVEKNTITISGMDKDLVGLFASKVRLKKKPEPYKGKGIRYSDEIIKRKQGKKVA